MSFSVYKCSWTSWCFGFTIPITKSSLWETAAYIQLPLSFCSPALAPTITMAYWRSTFRNCSVSHVFHTLFQLHNTCSGSWQDALMDDSEGMLCAPEHHPGTRTWLTLRRGHSSMLWLYLLPPEVWLTLSVFLSNLVTTTTVSSPTKFISQHQPVERFHDKTRVFCSVWLSHQRSHDNRSAQGTECFLGRFTVVV